jgi:D-alanyl-lipoteichoic acid acyltransferase DltB (MBOAT superfamily)
MLFHTWPFLIFLLIVLPGFFALRRTSFWIPWLLLASYFFYGWWKPVYLLLVVYSTVLDYLLVTLMDHCPRSDNVIARAPEVSDGDDLQPPRLEYAERPAPDPVLRQAFIVSASLTIALAIGAAVGPTKLRPTFTMFAVLVMLMAIGAKLASRWIWLLISLVNNLTLLLFFKYARFVEENLNQVFAWFHLSLKLADPSTLMPPHWEYALPVGISFFTFQSMSYTIDFYLGKVPRERNLVRFATFVCFFPQLMAGPIERARQMLPQFQLAPPFCLQNLTDGMSLFLVGLFKKLALANYLAMFVDRFYDNPAGAGGMQLALATFAFAWQIFFDFSGYTDMARGVAKMMGFNLILNFNNPYMAAGLGEFWWRWHISLSSWFRDYVYIPLGGSRRGTPAIYRNLLITFVVSGIWHGANWTFLIWGALHAVGVMVTRELERSRFYRERIGLGVKRVGVFLYVCFAWIFFRASSLSDALLIVQRIFTSALRAPQIPALMLVLVVSVVIYQTMYESRLRGLLKFSPVRVALAVSMILYLGLCSTRGEAFIYFQF